MRKKVYARERKPTDGERGRQEQAARRETRVAERQKRNIGHTRPNRNRDKHGEGLFSLARDSICGARVCARFSFTDEGRAPSPISGDTNETAFASLFLAR